jgi:RNA polymerase sigma factor (sigma-70 family)
MATTAPLPREFDPERLDELGDEALARLVTDAGEGEPAFAVLYERHHQALYRYCRSIVRDDLDAQDALQSAWTRALIALRRGQRDAPLRPWLYRIAHNESISQLRRRQRRSEPAEISTANAPSAEDHAIDREQFALLVTDLHQLPDRPRGALLMRELSGLTHEEIADALETSVAAAKQCVYEARQHLADFAAGRATSCDDICRSISDGDRRVLRGRRVTAHLRHCPSCAAFASTIDQRRTALHAFTPWLASPAAIVALDGVLRAGWTSGARTASVGAGSASVGSVGGAATGAGGASAIGTAAPAALAGGVVTKAVGASLLSKALVAAAAVTVGVASVAGIGGTGHGPAHPVPVHRAAASPAGRGAVLHVAAGAGRARTATASAAQRASAAARLAAFANPGRHRGAGHGAAATAPGHLKKAAGSATSAASGSRGHRGVKAHGNPAAAPGSSHGAAATAHGATTKGTAAHGTKAHGTRTHGATARESAKPKTRSRPAARTANGNANGTTRTATSTHAAIHKAKRAHAKPPKANAPVPARASATATAPPAPGNSGVAHSN